MKEYKELFDDYMQRPKEELAALLTIAELKEEHDKAYAPIMPPKAPTWMCRDWNDCTNPHMDCINCPIKNKTGQYTLNGYGWGTFGPTKAHRDEFQISC